MLNDVIVQMNPADSSGTFHPKITECMIFSAACGTSLKVTKHYKMKQVSTNSGKLNFFVFALNIVE